MSVDPASLVFITLIVVAGLALAAGWTRLIALIHPADRKRRFMSLALVVSTTSYLYFVACLFAPDFLLGAAFSQQRSISLYANFGIALVILFFSMANKNSLRPPLVLANSALFVMWVLVGAASSAI
jgi:hypothetical protein